MVSLIAALCLLLAGPTAGNGQFQARFAAFARNPGVADARLSSLLSTTNAPVGSGSVEIIARDEAHLPLPGATTQLLEAGRGTVREATTDGSGRCRFDQLPAGRYEIRVALAGFSPAIAWFDLADGDHAREDVTLAVQPISAHVGVTAPHLPEHNPAAATTERLTQHDLDHMPGALRPGSLNAITDTAPSAVVAHDELHMRGGHETAFAIDGTTVPTSSLGGRFGLLFDPMDVKTMELDRAAYSAQYANTVCGLVNVVTQSGFDRDNSGETTISVGQQATYQAGGSYGGHSQSVAYFGQASAYRTAFGLTPPALPAIHDDARGADGAARISAPVGTRSLLSISSVLRADHFDIPAWPAAATDGVGLQLERHAFLTARLEHATAGALTWSLTGYFDYSRVALSGVGDLESSGIGSPSQDDRSLRHAGVRADGVYERGRHQVKAGIDMRRGSLDDAIDLAGTASALPAAVAVEQGVPAAAAYIEDTVRAGSRVSLMGGLRWDVNAQPALREQAFEPRVGLVARLGGPFVAHFNAGRFFQPPPLESLVLPAIAVVNEGAPFELIRAERSTQWEGGVSATLARATLDATYYDTHATSYLDHQQLGASSLFLPVNLARARLRGLEVTISSPSDAPLVARVAYSHGYAQAAGAVTGGLGDLEPRSDGVYFLDHDQRNTLVASLQWQPTTRYWLCTAFRYGSGFLLDDGPAHLPGHSTVDIGSGVRVRRDWLIAADVENVANAIYFINLSSEFNGTHVSRPRSATVRLLVRF